MTAASSYRANLRKINWHGFLSGFQPFVPILFIYFQNQGLSYTQIGLLISAFWVGNLLFEVPSGVFSDHFGRKHSLALAALIYTLSFLLFFVGSSFPIFLVAYLLYGIGEAFISGSDSSLIHDTLKEEGKEAEFGKWLGKKYAYFLYAAGLSGLAASAFNPALFKYSFAVAALCAFGSLLVILSVREPGIQQPSEDRNYFKHLKGAVSLLLRHSTVRALLFYYIAVNLTIQIFFPYIQFFLKAAGVPTHYNGIFYALFVGLAAFASSNGHQVERLLTRKVVLFLMPIGLFVSFFLLGKTSMALVIVLFILVVEFIFGMNRPVTSNYFHTFVDSHHRATVESLRSLVLSVSILVLAPVFGRLADSSGIGAMSSVLGGFILVVGVASALYLKNKK